MNRHISLFILGIAVILIPLSGFPIFWKGTFEVVAGVAIATLSGFLYREEVMRGTDPSHKVSSHARTYIENE